MARGEARGGDVIVPPRALVAGVLSSSRPN